MAIGIKAWADDFKIMLTEAHQRRQQMSSLNIPSNNFQSANISPQLEVCTLESIYVMHIQWSYTCDLTATRYL